MSPTASTPAPVRDSSGDGSSPPDAARPCPICSTPLASTRARYCSAACKQRAFRLRRPSAPPPDLATLRRELRRQGALAAHMVYACPACDERLVGRQRCPECQLFCRALGLGGTCPDCDAVLLLADLVDPVTEKGGT